MNPDLFPDIVSASGVFPALLDTCVLYPSILRNVLLEAAHQQLYRAHWSTKVLVELERNLRQSGRSDNYIQRLCATMNEAFPEAVVDVDEDLARSLACDPKDRHVLAAAISSRSEILVTLNTKDFPMTATAPFGVDVLRPDDFLLDLFELSRPRMMACLEAVANRHKRFPCTLEEMLQSNGLNQVAPGFTRTCRDYLISRPQ